MGGGLTADLFAHAVIAAARVYGDDPAGAITAPRSAIVRRSLSAAAGGMYEALGCGLGEICRPLGVRQDSVSAARGKALPGFLKAQAAAERAVFAVIKPARPRACGDPDEHQPAAPSPLGPRLRGDERGLVPLDRAILDMLADGAHTTVALSTRLMAKELAVGMQLSLLRHAGRVVCDPLGDGGLRAQLWRIAPQADGVHG